MKKLFFLLSFLFILFGCNNEENILVDPIIESLTIESIIDRETISLPNDFQGIDITWESSKPNIINTLGSVQRVYLDEEVILSAYYTFNGKTLTKSFVVTVKGNPLSDLEIILLDAAKLNIKSITDSDLILPSYGINGSRILWTSSKPYIISHQGTYYKPIDDETVTLTAIIISGQTQQSYSYEIIALGMTNSEKVEKDLYMLDIQIPTILDNLVLPKRGYFQSNITWESSHPHILNSNGKYTKPIGNHIVTLTATIQKGEQTMTKTFDINVNGYNPDTFFIEVEKKLAINHGIDVIFEDVSLPTTILDIASISWESSHPSVLSETGDFNLSDETTHVELTATITANSYEKQICFPYIIYGRNDQSSDLDHQKISKIDINNQDLYYLDIAEKLTYGTYENIIYKQNRLMLKGQETSGAYTSPVLHSSEAITKINFMWGSISNQHATTEFLTRYLTTQGWSNWTSHGIWGYGGNNQPPEITKSFPSNVYEIQYKINFNRLSIDISSPQLTMISIQFLTQNNKPYARETLRHHVLYDVPQLRQADTTDPFLWNNICWATSISMMLNYYDKLIDLKVPQEYYSVLIRQGTERFGTTKNDIGSTQFGIIMHELEFYSENMLLHVLDHYGPIIVGVSKGSSSDGKFGPLTYSSGHVIVVVGYKINTDGSVAIIVNDPAVSWIRETFTGSLEEFMLVWDKGGMLMQPYPLM